LPPRHSTGTCKEDLPICRFCMKNSSLTKMHPHGEKDQIGDSYPVIR
jgi:hypothetical protein